jgi:hypothetical protein
LRTRRRCTPDRLASLLSARSQGNAPVKHRDTPELIQLRSVDPLGSLAGKTVTGGRLNVAKAIRVVAPPTPDFRVSVSPASAQVAPGAAASFLASTSRSAAVITWNTNEAADSQVQYGRSESFGNATTKDPLLVTSHRVRISGLPQERRYDFRARSAEPRGT